MFIDNLALTEALLALAATMLAYMGITTWWALRTNNPEDVRASLRGAAIPVGSVGLMSVILGVWSEMVWPYPAAMGGYNILFNDITLAFGLVLVSFAIAAYLNLKLQFVGVLAFAAGIVTVFYGWTAYGFNYTKEPLDFLLLYLGFGVAGMATLPATVILDYYLGTVAKSDQIWRSSEPSQNPIKGLGARGVMGFGRSRNTEGTEKIHYHVPLVLQLVLLAFPILMALAGIAAWWFLGTTLPGHLTPGKTP